LEQKRRALRHALKTEFIKLRYHPELVTKSDGIVFDSAMQRWYAMENTRGDYFYPTLKNFSKFMVLQVLPVALFTYFFTKSRVS
jgi:hypothetical protein